MKITTFNPLIVTAHPEETIALFEALGFERRHKKQNVNEVGTSDVRMSLGDFRVDVADVKSVPQDIPMIRINVDNYEEAYDFLISKGFKKAFDTKVSEDATGKGTSLISPSGFIIALAQHKK